MSVVCWDLVYSNVHSSSPTIHHHVSSTYTVARGEILSHPENSIPQTIVLRYLEIGSILCTKHRSDGIVSI
jgi:hypothetical protein